MASKKSGLTLLLLAFLALAPGGCGILCNNPCGCNPTFPEQSARIRSFELLTFSTGGQQITPSLNQPYDQVVKAFRIKDFDLISSAEKSSNFNWNLGVAYACSPPPITVDKQLIDLRIINQEEVILGDGTRWEVGQELSEFFGMNSFFSSSLVPIDEFIGEGLTLILEDFLKVGLIKDPGKSLELKLSFNLVLENGETFQISNEILSVRSKN
ncbi:hypothetical protein Aoki45_01230 [Algoriphagus sp. oki45]|uniref:hypothetical protein n=1 Tax=Algoriphagus sp. oki45 TaxID=3067294 RepID=UPI0028000F39|nr:hypothetical protein Aoki45_01230 [Algoriphagus sp. oki45]